MMEARVIGEAVASAAAEAASNLRPDVLEALRSAASHETSERGRAVLGQLIDNAELAAVQRVPLCQDTGAVWVRIEMGMEETVSGDLQREVDDAVARVWEKAALRPSMCRDAAFDRSNSGDNTPAFVDVVPRPGKGLRVDVMLKGGGSDNASAMTMLEPGAGLAGVSRFVLDTVAAKGAGACPPLLVGVGVGSTFDGVAGLAKKALLRPIGPSADARAAALEADLVAAINETGIGPGGLGGSTTALAVHLETAPCHIAALPVAVNMGCCAVRSASAEIA